MKDYSLVCFAIVFSLLICSFIVFLSEFNQYRAKHDCRMATYPCAIDIPKEIIKQCKEKK
jgi:hypothetical protein